MDRTTAADAQWLAMQMPSAIRTSIDWGNIDRVAAARHTGPPSLESLYGQPMSKELNDLARLLRPTSPHSPAFPRTTTQGDQDEGSPTYMLLNLLGLLPGSGSGMDRSQAFQAPRLPVSPLNFSDQSGTGSLLSDRTGDRLADRPNDLAQWTSLLQQQSRQRREDMRNGGISHAGHQHQHQHHLSQLDHHTLRTDLVKLEHAPPSHHAHYASADARRHGYGNRHESDHGHSTLFEFSSEQPAQPNGGNADPQYDSLHPDLHLSSAHKARRRPTPPESPPAPPPARPTPNKRAKPDPSPGKSGGVSKAKAAKSAAGNAEQDLFGPWNDDTKASLMEMVEKYNPRGQKDWQLIADALGRPGGGASAERMYRSLTNPEYQRPANKHGRRLNPRKGIPMHVMATYALLRLPDKEGNLSEMASKIEENKYFCKHLDWTPRPGTKTYPRWKDALVGCFKPGRYPHLKKTNRKRESLTVYMLIEELIPEKSRLKPSMMADADPADLPSDFERDTKAQAVPAGRSKAVKDVDDDMSTEDDDDGGRGQPHGTRQQVRQEAKRDGAEGLGHRPGAQPALHDYPNDGVQGAGSLLPGLSLLPGGSLLGRVDSHTLNEMPSDLLHLLQNHGSDVRHVPA